MIAAFAIFFHDLCASFRVNAFRPSGFMQNPRILGLDLRQTGQDKGEFLLVIHSAQHSMPNVCPQTVRIHSPWVWLFKHTAHEFLLSDSKFQRLIGTIFTRLILPDVSIRVIPHTCVEFSMSVRLARSGTSSGVIATMSLFRFTFRSTLSVILSLFVVCCLLFVVCFVLFIRNQWKVGSIHWIKKHFNFLGTLGIQQESFFQVKK